ncbi:hypothetical protein V5O48_015350 [Marasmius crinis-equi]|uniref:Uncharacterized protein n=1 Tax=Marasmius crinis-equi TaxID=585013 RepID=A0ABR3EUR8_9AGAR
MANGESRFQLKDGGGSWLRLETNEQEDWLVWLSQASSVFCACGISLDNADRDCGSPSTPTESCLTASYHYWSSEPTGRPPLSANACDFFGLPVQLNLHIPLYTPHPWFLSFSFPNAVYKRIHQYQLARGFDPTTCDFARSLGYPIYQVQNDAHRFEAVDASHTSSTTRSSATTLASGVIPPTEQLAEPVAPLPNPILSPSDSRVRAEQSAYAAKETSPPGPSSRRGANGRMLVNESKPQYVPAKPRVPGTPNHRTLTSPGNSVPNGERRKETTVPGTDTPILSGLVGSRPSPAAKSTFMEPRLRGAILDSTATTTLHPKRPQKQSSVEKACVPPVVKASSRGGPPPPPMKISSAALTTTPTTKGATQSSTSNTWGWIPNRP